MKSTRALHYGIPQNLALRGWSFGSEWEPLVQARARKVIWVSWSSWRRRQAKRSTGRCRRPKRNSRCCCWARGSSRLHCRVKRSGRRVIWMSRAVSWQGCKVVWEVQAGRRSSPIRVPLSTSGQNLSQKQLLGCWAGGELWAISWVLNNHIPEDCTKWSNLFWLYKCNIPEVE